MFIIREELNYGIRTHNVLSTVASLNHWAGTFKPRMTSFRLVVRQHERRVQVVSSNLTSPTRGKRSKSPVRGRFSLF